MFDNTVFNRMALFLGEIAKELKRANDLKQAEMQKASVPKRIDGPYTGNPQTVPTTTTWPSQAQFTAINPAQTEY